MSHVRKDIPQEPVTHIRQRPRTRKGRSRPHKHITFGALQEHLSQILDEIVATGIPVELERAGQRFEILPLVPQKMKPSRNKLDTLPERPYLQCAPEDLVHVDWSQEWKPHDVS